MSAVREELARWQGFFNDLGLKVDIDTALKIMDKVQFVKPPVQRTDPISLGQKINEMRDILDEVEVGHVFGDGSIHALVKAVGLEATQSDMYHIRTAMKEDPRIEHRPKQAEQFVKKLPPPTPAPVTTETIENMMDP